MTEEAKLIVAALRTSCEENGSCPDCPVNYWCHAKNGVRIEDDAADLIESLSAENEILNAAIGQLGTIECHRDMLEHELEQVTRERDAAVERGGIRKALRIAETAPTVDAVSLGVYEQVKWERDVAIKLLEALGIDFGQKKPDMEPVRYGKWKYYSPTMMECSICKRHASRHKFKYCPNCGAKMDGDKDAVD